LLHYIAINFYIKGSIVKRNLLLLPMLALFTFAWLNAGDFITITDPVSSGSGTVNGSPLVIDGTSSQANCMAQLFLNTNFIASVTTDGSGNWSYTVPGVINNGTYELNVLLLNSAYSILASNSVSFTVNSGNWITIGNPIEGQLTLLNPISISGQSSLANATINILLDSNQIGTTTTDQNGNWTYSYTLSASNGAHTFLAQLLSAGYPVASATVDVVNSIPFLFPSGTSQARFVNGDIPTSGSGSGTGYTYSVSGSTITINFVPAFNVTPSMTTTGLRSSGSSTTSLTSVSTTAATVGFSSGTQMVHFSAATLQ
jgi:large repetitive protein